MTGAIASTSGMCAVFCGVSPRTPKTLAQTTVSKTRVQLTVRNANIARFLHTRRSSLVIHATQRQQSLVAIAPGTSLQHATCARVRSETSTAVPRRRLQTVHLTVCVMVMSMSLAGAVSPSIRPDSDSAVDIDAGSTPVGATSMCTPALLM